MVCYTSTGSSQNQLGLLSNSELDLEQLISIYLSEDPKSSKQHVLDVCSGVSVCCCSTLSLDNYALAKTVLCNRTHEQPCNQCAQLLKVADVVLKEGFITLGEAFCLVSPNAKYDTAQAKRKMLQLPLASIRIGLPSSGRAYTLLVEHQHSLDYEKLSLMINSLLGCSKSPSVIIDKSTVKKLLGIAQSDHERQCIRYAVFKASGVTLTQARKKFGFENMGKKAQHVEVCINSNRAIREAIDDLATTEDEALLASFGIFPDNNIITLDSEDSDSLSLSTLSETEEGFEAVAAAAEDALSLENFKQIVCGCQYNWFDIVEAALKLVKQV